MLLRGLTLLLCSSHTWRSLDASDLLLGDIYWPKYKVTHPFFLHFSLSFFPLTHLAIIYNNQKSSDLSNCLHITPLIMTGYYLSLYAFGSINCYVIGYAKSNLHLATKTCLCKKDINLSFSIPTLKYMQSKSCHWNIVFAQSGR